MPDIDILSAARSVVTRFSAAKDAGHTDIALRMSEAAALLPVLEALAAGADADRVERWARVLCQADGHTPDEIADPKTYPGRFGLLSLVDSRRWHNYEDRARAAMALADAEKAAEAAQGWAAYEEAREDFERSCTKWGHERAGADEKQEVMADRTALDAAVRRLGAK